MIALDVASYLLGLLAGAVAAGFTAWAIVDYRRARLVGSLFCSHGVLLGDLNPVPCQKCAAEVGR